MVSLSNITKFVGGVPLYEDVGFQINPGEKIGLVGPNGAGKTTFFRMIVGEEQPDKGGSQHSEWGENIIFFSKRGRDERTKCSTGGNFWEFSSCRTFCPAENI
jgi:ABC-type branched-subunit amino acid transport system ATPase component